MDVDSNDIDGNLLQQFSSLGTTDRDVLVLEFQKLVGNDPNPSLCAFYLDMNNWYVHLFFVLAFANVLFLFTGTYLRL